MTETTKYCPKCATDHPVAFFYNDKKTKDGLTAYCKDYYAQYYKANRERQMETSQKARIARRYGLEWDHYQQLLTAGCVVCGSEDRLHVDHDHITGETRGVLCSQCNVALGQLGDCPDRLRKLADWIETKPVIAQGLPGPSY